jgi:oligopeptide transport system ATP-binding protein
MSGAAIPATGPDSAVSLLRPARESILEVAGVDVTYSRGGFLRANQLHALVGADLTVTRGEVVGIIGESGSGKSTLARAISGLAHIARGSIRVDGRDVVNGSAKRRREASRGVQLVFQNPYASLAPKWSVERIVAEPLDVWERALPAEERTERVREALEMVAIDPGRMGERTSAFSGGQRQRIALARALISRPDLLICDEVLSALDVSSQAQMVQLLRHINQDLHCAILLISHNVAALRFIASRIVVMYAGRIVEVAPTDEIIDSPRHPYTKSLVAAARAVDLHDGDVVQEVIGGDVPDPSRLGEGCVFRARCPDAREACGPKEPEAVQLGGGVMVRCVDFADQGAPA